MNYRIQNRFLLDTLFLIENELNFLRIRINSNSRIITRNRTPNLPDVPKTQTMASTKKRFMAILVHTLHNRELHSMLFSFRLHRLEYIFSHTLGAFCYRFLHDDPRNNDFFMGIKYSKTKNILRIKRKNNHTRPLQIFQKPPIHRICFILVGCHIFFQLSICYHNWLDWNYPVPIYSFCRGILAKRPIPGRIP